MGSRSKKIISMIPVQQNASVGKKELVETWLSNLHPEDQNNDHNYNAENSRLFNLSSTSDDRQIDLPVTERSNEKDNNMDTVGVDVDSILKNTVTKNMDVIIDGEKLDRLNDAEIVSSNSIIDSVAQNTLVKTILTEDTISIDNNNEDFSPSDGSEYKPPHKKQPRKLVFPSLLSKPGQWQKNQRKYLKNTGQAYTSTRGKPMSEKIIRPSCMYTCRLSCSTKFSTEERNMIFKTYWDLGSFQRQRDFLASCVKQVEPEYRTIKIKKGGDMQRKCRKPNISFFLMNNGKEIRVCKTFLLNTLAISDKPLRTVIQSKFGSVSVIPTDKRGKHGKQSKLDPEIIQSVRDHINSIPRIESHYIRANSTREYIDGGLTVAELHRNYQESRISNNKEPANYDAYHRIFNTQFNISFFIPRKDQCDVCEAYKNAVDKEPLTFKYNQHQEEKCLSRLEKKQNIEECKKSDTNTIVAIFDLQAVLPCPLGQSSAFFYKSKLNCYNFTVSNIKDEKTYCFFWHEGLGKRGANEIGSCLYNFLKECSTSNPNSDIIFFSDNCCGQQKNKFILSLYYYAVSILPIRSITHKFLIRGHTQNEADSVHSIIEKNIRRAKKSGPIYTPDQYVGLIRNAKKTGNSFIVNEMNYNDFYDLKLLSNDINLNTAKNCDGEPIRISDIKVVQFVKDSDTYKYKTTYKTELWNEAKIKISRAGKKNITDINLSAAYSSNLPIANNKKQDIRQLITDNIVPRYYENVYNSIFE